MRDGFKHYVVGGVVGLILLAVGVFIIIKAGVENVDDKVGWIIGILVPIFSGLIVWYVRLVDRIKKEDMDRIFEAINSKAPNEKLVALENKVTDHKEATDSKHEQLFEMIVSIDHKLDILIEKR